MREEIEKYYSLAIKHLARRPRSTKEIKDYLIKKKVDPDIIEVIVNSLLDHRFLSDLEFARWWREQRTRFKRKSDRLIVFELRQKGIAQEIIDKVFQEETDEPMDDLTKAKKLVIKRLKRVEGLSTKEQYEKLGRYLLGKGFNWEIIKRAIDDILQKKYNDDQ